MRVIGIYSFWDAAALQLCNYIKITSKDIIILTSFLIFLLDSIPKLQLLNIASSFSIIIRCVLIQSGPQCPVLSLRFYSCFICSF